jgi:hypothetical protein
MMRRTAGVATALVTTLGLAASAHANTGSTTFAGYIDSLSAGHWKISATMIVPKVTCTAGENREILAEIGVESASTPSHVGLVLGCVNGKVTYQPYLELNGSTAYTTASMMRAGDVLKLTVDLTAGASESIVDTTHTYKDTRQSPQGEMVSSPFVGDLARSFNGALSGVPNFGTLHFSAVLVNGAPLGSSSSLASYNRVSSTGTLQIATSALASNKEAFTTTFKHA